MGDLTTNFSRNEFACRCCERYLLNARLLMGLQALRDLIGKPIEVSSGYRCKKHNHEVGGTENSQHLEGKAGDIIVGIPLIELYEYAMAIPDFRNGGVGMYPQEGFMHVDVRNGRARWGRINGDYTTIQQALRLEV